MKNFKSINEVRKKIDVMDAKILDLIADRRKLVIEAVKHKRKDQIVDKERIEKIIKSLRKNAKDRELSEDMIEAIWRKMIQGFIDYERKIYDKVHQKKN